MDVEAPSPAGSGRDLEWAAALRGPFLALAGGDAAALETIWEVASRRLFGLALWRTGNAEDASDVVQEVFVRLASRRAELSRVSTPHLWLLKVTHNLAVDRLRRRERRRSEAIESAGLVAAPVHDPGRRVEAERMSRLLAELPEAQREAVALRHVEGCSYREIGRITGVPTFTAASRCRLGLARLRRLMG